MPRIIIKGGVWRNTEVSALTFDWFSFEYMINSNGKPVCFPKQASTGIWINWGLATQSHESDTCIYTHNTHVPTTDQLA